MTSRKVQKILIIKPSALGDIALALPALGSIRKSFPDAEISWLVRKEFAPLLEMAGDVDNIIIFDRKLLGKWFIKPKAFTGLMRFFKTLRSTHFDIIIDLQGLFRTALFGKITGCKKRFGIKGAREFASIFYTDKIPQDDDCIHLVDLNNRIIKAAGATETVLNYDLNIDEQTELTADKLLTEKGVIENKYAVMVTGAAHANKCWPPEKFAELADRLHDNFNLSIITVGTNIDKGGIEKVKNLAKTDIIDLAGKTNIKVLTALINKAAVVITNDTGPGHIAVAANAPVVMIFGPTNPARIAPYNKPECFVADDAFTRGMEIASNDPKYAIEKISVDRVFRKAEALIIDKR